MCKDLNTEWRLRPDLNWCPDCWFSAEIESKTTEAMEKFHCFNCGYIAHIWYNTDENCQWNAIKNISPRYFTDEEWHKFWAENYKIEQKDLF